MSTATITPNRAARRKAVRLSAAVMAPAVVALSSSPAYAAAPNPGQEQPPGTEGLLTMLNWGGWAVSLVCVVGFLVVAAMMALKHKRGESGESMGALGWVMGACVLGTAAGPIANALI